ncbi:MAG: hypothetical protein HN576_06370 [Bacteriovoracaceae bacterium]|nr:hypothetical protein [Bacteriovoracaceae bacterium]
MANTKKFVNIKYLSMKNGSIFISMKDTVFVLDTLQIIKMISANTQQVEADIRKKHSSK